MGHNASVYRSHESRKAANTCGYFSYTIGSLTYTGGQHRFWGNAMAERLLLDHAWREHVIGMGVRDDESEAMREVWSAFAADPAGVFSIPCGQVICMKE